MADRDFIVSGERAALGMLRREHLPALASWFNDPDVRRGLAHRGVVNVEAEEKWFEAMTEAGGAPRPETVAFAVHSADDGELVGACSLEEIDHNLLETYDFNAAAQRAYERAGFRVIGRRRDSVLALGRRWDVILMDATADDFDSPGLARLLPEV